MMFVNVNKSYYKAEANEEKLAYKTTQLKIKIRHAICIFTALIQQLCFLNIWINLNDIIETTYYIQKTFF